MKKYFILLALGVSVNQAFADDQKLQLDYTVTYTHAKVTIMTNTSIPDGKARIQDEILRNDNTCLMGITELAGELKDQSQQKNATILITYSETKDEHMKSSKQAIGLRFDLPNVYLGGDGSNNLIKDTTSLGCKNELKNLYVQLKDRYLALESASEKRKYKISKFEHTFAQ